MFVGNFDWTVGAEIVGLWILPRFVDRDDEDQKTVLKEDRKARHIFSEEISKMGNVFRLL